MIELLSAARNTSVTASAARNASDAASAAPTASDAASAARYASDAASAARKTGAGQAKLNQRRPWPSQGPQTLAGLGGSPLAPRCCFVVVWLWLWLFVVVNFRISLSFCFFLELISANHTDLCTRVPRAWGKAGVQVGA